MNDFEFELNEPVRIIVSGEVGTIVGRAEYLAMDNQYLVRYKAADGRATEAWWPADALVYEAPR